MEFTVRTNRTEFAKFAVEVLLPLVEQRGLPASIGHPSLESRELKVNGLVVVRSEFILPEPSNSHRHVVLDVWPVGGNKVLSVSLLPFKIVSFKPGAWMGLVIDLAKSSTVGGNSMGREPMTRQDSSDSTRGSGIEPRIDLRPAPKEIWQLIVRRHSVEAGDVSSVLSFLRSISSDESSAWRMRGQISISFDGYSHERRAIFTVPEVREFVARIHAAWPYWFFFLNQVDHSIKVVAACLCDMRRVEPASWRLSQADLMRFVGEGMTAMGDLGKRYRFDDAEMDAIATGVFQYLHAELG
jgi:hypothetical protein